MSSALVHEHHRPAFDLDLFAPAGEQHRKWLAGQRRRVVVDDVTLLQLSWVGWSTVVLYVRRARAGHVLELGDAAGNHRGSRQGIPPDHAVGAIADQVDVPITHPQGDLYIRISRAERVQRGDQDGVGENRRDIDSQSPLWLGPLIGDKPVHVVDIADDTNSALVIRSAFRRDGNLPRGAVKQLHTQVGLQFLYQLRRRGRWHFERFGGPDEGAGVG